MNTTLRTFSGNNSTTSTTAPFRNYFVKLLIGVLFVLGGLGANAQNVTVTNPANTTPGLLANYPTLAAAITDLNAQTAISGPVIITLTAAETAPAGGYSITAIPTGASGTNNITIDGGSNIVTAFTPQTVGNTNDAIFKIIGADFITLQHFTMVENAGNTINGTGATNNMTEFGVALFYATTTNGAQSNIIQNNTISLNRSYLNTFGIYSNTRTSATSMTTSAEATSAAGSNSFNKIYSNAISNVNYGIVFIGCGTTIAAIDNGNDIGGSSAGTGNTITNWGGGAALTSYVSLTGSNYCIFDNQQINDNVSFNTITSAALAQSATTGGVLKNYSVASPTGTITTTINNNTVTVTNNPTAATTGSVIGLNNQGLTSLLATATMSMNNNTIQNCTLGGATSTTNGITGITNLSLPGVMNMNGNSVIGNAITATTATSGTNNGMSNSGAAGTLNMNNNIIRNLASTATSGQPQGITNSGVVVNAININSNQLGNASGGFFSTSTATSGSLFAIANSGGGAACVVTIQNNDIRGITYNVAASAAQNYIQQLAAVATSLISTNTFTNLNVNTTGTTTFISQTYTASATATKTVTNNSIVTAFNRGGASGSTILVTDNGSSVTGCVSNCTNNNFSNITLAGTSSITGINLTDGGSAPTHIITGNTFNSWTTLTGAINVINVTYWNGVSTLSNNNITNITGQAAVTGITMGNTVATATSVAVSTNTLTNLTSTGTGGAVTGITNTNTSVGITFGSNIINNLSSTSLTATVVGITTSASCVISGNTINTLSNVGTTSGVTNGIMVTGGAAVTVSKNKIYDLSTTGAFTTVPGVNGILLSGTTSGASINVFNNLVGDLRAATSASTDAIRGLSITSTGTSSNYNISYNTVYLNATSSGTNFGTTGLFHAASATASTATLNLRNNIIVNNSAAGGTGTVVAFRRSVGTAGTLANYGGASNNNEFNAGTPGATNLIYSDGTSTATTIAAYKAGVFTAGTISTRDNVSFSEVISSTPGVYFQSFTGTDPTFLHMVNGLTTPVEGGAVPIGGITDDYDGNLRNINTPDVGADEFNGVSPAPVVNTVSISPVGNQCTNIARTVTANITPVNPLTAVTLNYSVNGGAPVPVTMSGGNPTATSDWTGTIPTVVPSNGNVTWSVTATDGTYSGSRTGTAYKDEPLTGVTATISATPSTLCSGGTTTLTATVSLSGTSASGPGASTNAAGGDPFYHLYGGAKTQLIYLASELTAMGFTAGNITALSLNITSLGTTPMNGFSISMGHTAQNAAVTNTAITTGLTSVYGGTGIAQALVAGNNTFNLTTPFPWNGTSNIVISFVFSNANTGGTSSTVTSDAAAFNSTLYILSDNATTACLLAAPASGQACMGTNTNGVTTSRPTINFTGNKAPAMSTYSWSDGTNIATGNPANLVIASVPATVTLTATDGNGCTITPAPTTSITAAPVLSALNVTTGATTLCGGVTTNLTATPVGGCPNFTYVWSSSPSAGVTFSNPNISNPTFSAAPSPAVQTVYTLTCTVTDASNNTASNNTIQITVNPTPAAGASSNSPVCSGNSLNLTGTTDVTGGTYSWTGPNSFIDGSLTPSIPNATTAASGTYNFSVSLNGCTSTIATTTVVVHQTPAAVTITPPSASICSGSSIGLTASGGNVSATGNATLGTAVTLTGLQTQPAAFVNRWAQYWNQTIYTAAELSAAGLSAGYSINSVTYNITALGDAANNTNFSIRIGNTGSSTLAAFQTTGLTTVYGPATYVHAVGANTITFTTPFVWDGSSNIILDVRQDGIDNFNNSNTYFTAAADNKNIEAHTSTTSGTTTLQALVASATVTPTASTTRLNIVLAYSLLQNPTWSWAPPTGLNTTSGASVTASPTSPTTYTATATISGCSSSNTVFVDVNPPATVNAGLDQSVCSNVNGVNPPTVQLAGSYGGAASLATWTGGAGSFNPDASTPNAIYTPTAGEISAGSVTLTLTTDDPTGPCGPVNDQMTITINTAPTVTFPGSFGPYCSNAAPVTLSGGSPAGGSYSGPGVTGTTFTPSAANIGANTITYTYFDGTCTNTATNSITVNAAPTVTFTGSFGPYCSNAAPVTLSGGSPAGGSYSGPGVTGTTFTPSAANTGANTITYTYSDGTCSNTATISITVNAAPTVTFTGSFGPYCSNAAPVTLSGGAPAGGTYSGPGVSGTTFTPSAANTGANTITYTYSDGTCSNTATISITVNAAPTVTFTGSFGPYCSNAAPVTLSGGSPAGGTYSGPGVTGTTFTPSAANTGANTITYTYSDGTCSNTATISITVNAAPTVTWTGSFGPYCSNDGPVSLSGGAPIFVGGTYSGPGVTGGNTFNPSLANIGPNTITYTYTDPVTNCSNSATKVITVNAAPTVTFTGSFGPYCSNAAPVTLSGGAPAGGSYSGPGVTGTTFTPSAANIGANTITYTYSDGTCSNTATISITVNAAPTVTFTGSFGPYCSNAAPVTLSGGAPAGGIYSGPGVSGTTFTPSAANTGANTITYTYSDGTCSNTATISITVNAAPTVTFTGSFGPYCSNAAPVTLSGGSPAGGTYSGPGVTGTTFTPSAANIGANTITYTYTSGGCTNTATNTITVNAAPTVTFTGSFGPYCSNAAPVTLSGGAPAGGIYSGPGVSGTTFTPSAANIGANTITYTYTSGGCTNTATNSITVNAAPTVTFPGSFGPYCSNAAPVTLSGGSPAGGTYSGPGVTGTTFTPSAANIGANTITYTYFDGTCTNTATNSITVNAAPTVTFTGSFGPYCSNAAPVTLSGGSPAGGTYSGPGVSGTTFTPSAANTGANTITYTYTSGGCTNTATNSITVNAAPTVTFTGSFGPYCSNAAPVTLSGGSPAGGTYSGPGVSGTTFTPSAANTGANTITYTYSDGTCSNTATISITVNAAPTVTFTGSFGPYCSSAAPVTLSGGSPAGGTYSGPGVTGTTFTPSAANIGANTITYTYTSGSCTNTATNSITVNAAPTVTFPGSFGPYCSNAAPVTLSGGSPAGGTYSGPGVSGTTFTPSAANIGANTITYTYTSGGCTNTATNSITVNAAPTVTFPGSFGPYCSNAAPVTLSGGSPAGGTYSGPGVSGTTFTPSAANIGANTITYTYTSGGCTNTATNSITVNAVPTVTFTGSFGPYCSNAAPVTLSGGSPAGGTYSGPGVSGTTFTPSAANIGANTITYTYTSGGCTNTATNSITVNAAPTVTFAGSFGPYCSNAAPVTLSGGSPAGGTYSGPGVSGTTFTPSAANIGANTITYTYTSGGCTNTATNSITVNAVPTVTFTGSFGPYCSNAAPVTLSGGSPAGGTYSGPGVSGTTFTPSAANVGANTITYTYTSSGCSNTATIVITVNNPPVVSAGSYGPLCSNAAPITLNGGTPSGGSYSGTGVTGGNTFNPSAGTQTITYTYSNGGCTTTANTVITVNPAGTASISGSTTVVQNSPSSPNITFSGTGGTKPYTFTYTVSGVGGTQTITTTGTNSVTTVPQSTAVLGTFTYTLVSMQYANGCFATITGSPTATITVVTSLAQPDMSPVVPEPISTLFTITQAKDGYAQVTNGTANPTTGVVTFRISKPANFTLTIPPAMATVGATPVNNANWSITDPGFGYYEISSTQPVAIPANSNIKIGFTLTAGNTINTSGIMTVTVLDDTGGATAGSGDSNNTDNQSITVFSIN